MQTIIRKNKMIKKGKGKNLLKKIHPERPLKELRWFDVLILTATI